MDLCNIDNIRGILKRHGFRFSKSLGQNFLTAAWVPEEIAESSEVDSGCCVLEIGPGMGALTRALAGRAHHVVAVELDRELIPVLDETLAGLNNITVINEDIMKCNLEALTREHFGGMKKLVCANLPYYITTPIVAHLLESKCFDAVTVMMQKEVAARLSSAPGCSDYGAFTVFVNYYAEVEILFEVPHGCFVPEPKVDSAVVRLNVRKNPIIVPRDEALFFRVVRASFAQRRKLLANGLAAVFGAQIPKERINEILNGLEMPSNVRGETLSIAQFCAIADAFYDEINC